MTRASHVAYYHVLTSALSMPPRVMLRGSCGLWLFIPKNRCLLLRVMIEVSGTMWLRAGVHFQEYPGTYYTLIEMFSLEDGAAPVPNVHWKIIGPCSYADCGAHQIEHYWPGQTWIRKQDQ